VTPVTIEARIADITTLDVDAIVNAANSQLAAGGGVCGAIFRAAGAQDLAAACAKVAPCPVGEARITPGFRLPARFVIHAVGPVWHGGGAGEAARLASAYRASIRLAVEAVRAAIEAHPGAIDRVVFACFSAEALDAYAAEGVKTSGLA